MSLPSLAIYYNKNNVIVHKEFINVGWVINEQTWLDCVNEYKLQNQKESHVLGNLSDMDMMKIMIPKTRRMAPETIANDIVSVQPMSSAGGSLFKIRYNSRYRIIRWIERKWDDTKEQYRRFGVYFKSVIREIS